MVDVVSMSKSHIVGCIVTDIVIHYVVNTQRSNIRNVVADRVVDVVPMNEGRIVGGVMADRMVDYIVYAQGSSVCNVMTD